MSHQHTLEAIRHIDENNIEHWFARDLRTALGITQWQKFQNAIDHAKVNCAMSDNAIHKHFINVCKSISMPYGGTKNILDYKLSRYACLTIVKYCDLHKAAIAEARDYFAIKPLEQEINELLAMLTQSEHLKYSQADDHTKNMLLYTAANRFAFVTHYEYVTFCNVKYKGLYRSEIEKDELCRLNGIS